MSEQEKVVLPEVIAEVMVFAGIFIGQVRI